MTTCDGPDVLFFECINLMPTVILQLLMFVHARNLLLNFFRTSDHTDPEEWPQMFLLVKLPFLLSKLVLHRFARLIFLQKPGTQLNSDLKPEQILKGLQRLCLQRKHGRPVPFGLSWRGRVVDKAAPRPLPTLRPSPILPESRARRHTITRVETRGLWPTRTRLLSTSQTASPSPCPSSESTISGAADTHT